LLRVVEGTGGRELDGVVIVEGPAVLKAWSTRTECDLVSPEFASTKCEGNDPVEYDRGGRCGGTVRLLPTSLARKICEHALHAQVLCS
jgi:hypothetical protein